ncbi:ssDNA endodeoxyribonuclease [Nowakowskiella sp. JEL0078]|nr:ssDNA endodeoxyribonuclease [Nowakowskiella sp. JEL0078]
MSAPLFGNRFEGRADSVRPIATLLRAITPKDLPSIHNCLCVITSEGLSFLVNDSNCVQLTAYIPTQLFRDFHQFVQKDPNQISQIQDSEFDNTVIPSIEDIHFGIDLTILLDCLTVFGQVASSNGSGNSWGQNANIGMKMEYPVNEELMLILEENGVVTECRIKTYESPELENMKTLFFLGNSPAKLSTWLKSAFSELDSSAERFSILVSPNAPFFRLSSKSLIGDTQIDYPKDAGVFDSFTCDKICLNSYKFSMMLLSIKALNVSTKTYIMINERGFMFIQFKIPTNENEASFVDFVISPLVDEEEE